ncbi:MAG: adenylate/guanylate cyclase domain-containing protein [Syntrophobacter sp.]
MPKEGVPARASIFKSHSFYLKILSVFLCLLILTLVPVIYYNYCGNKLIVLELSDDLTDQITDTVVEKMNNYFAPASVLVRMSAVLVKAGAISCDNDEQIEMYTLGLLDSYPQVAMFYLGDEQGKHIRAGRLENGIVESRLVRPDASPPTDKSICRGPNFEEIITDVSTIIDYDPRVRPWYIGAKETRGNYWTDLYISFRNKKPAITSSYPVIDNEGNFLGAWGVDIELNQICDFLKSIEIGKTGITFILNAKNEVVAFPDQSKIVKDENGSLRPVRVDELGVSYIDAAMQKHLETGNNLLIVKSEGETYFASFSEFPDSFPVRWKIVTIFPADDFIGNAKEIVKKSVLICSFILLFSIILVILVSRSVTHPIRMLAEETKRIKNFELDDKLELVSYIKEIQMMRDSISAMKMGLQAFGKYVPAQLVRRLIETGEEVRLGGSKRELTVFFSDIVGFTSIAERTTPEDLMIHLSEYFDELSRIMSDQKGTVDKYIGDGIMAFWGAPLHDENHAYNACNASLLCQRKLAELNKKWRQEGKSLFVTRIGISTGETVFGNVGSSERINYTVMGDNVNLASRLEGVNKLFRTKIIVSSKTYEQTSGSFWFRPLGIFAVKGKSEKSEIYELLGRKDGEESKAVAELCREFTEGIEAYFAHDWNVAFKVFSMLAAKYPLDGPTHFYLSRCMQYCDTPPAADWDGIEYLESK